MQDIRSQRIRRIPSVTGLATAIRLAATTNEIKGTFLTKQKVRLKAFASQEIQVTFRKITTTQPYMGQQAK